MQDDSDAIDAGLLRFGGKRRCEKSASHGAEERSAIHH
jgi:hypothetical protein